MTNVLAAEMCELCIYTGRKTKVLFPISFLNEKRYLKEHVSLKSNKIISACRHRCDKDANNIIYGDVISLNFILIL